MTATRSSTRILSMNTYQDNPVEVQSATDTSNIAQSPRSNALLMLSEAAAQGVKLNGKAQIIEAPQLQPQTINNQRQQAVESNDGIKKEREETASPTSVGFNQPRPHSALGLAIKVPRVLPQAPGSASSTNGHPQYPMPPPPIQTQPSPHSPYHQMSNGSGSNSARTPTDSLTQSPHMAPIPLHHHGRLPGASTIIHGPFHAPPPPPMGMPMPMHVHGHPLPNGFENGNGNAPNGQPTKRVMQNREAQRNYRRRREQYIKDLEAQASEFSELQQKHAVISKKVAKYKRSINKLKDIVKKLQSRELERRMKEVQNGNGEEKLILEDEFMWIEDSSDEEEDGSVSK